MRKTEKPSSLSSEQNVEKSNQESSEMAPLVNKDDSYDPLSP